MLRGTGEDDNKQLDTKVIGLFVGHVFSYASFFLFFFNALFSNHYERLHTHSKP